jgi:predicted RecA/RadA family phage recombinase
MAKNEVFKDAEGLSLPVATGVKSGTALRIGILNAVAQTDEGSVTNPDYVFAGIAQPTGGIGNEAGYATVKTTGAWIVTVTGSTTVGSAVYIKADGTLTTASTGNFLWGVALRASTAPATPVIVRILNPGQTVASA